VRADDQPRPHVQRALAEDAVDLGLAERLQRAVVGEVGRQLAGGRVAEVGDGAVLARPGREVGVDRDGRDEDVAAGVAQLLGEPSDAGGEVAGRVDDDVPRAAGERREVGRPVAAQVLGLGEEPRVRRPAVEERQLVPARERVLGDGAAEELRPAEDQDAQSSPSAASRRSTSAAVL
jgi:hypothetical protein